MRITPFVLAISGCIGLVAACAHAQTSSVTDAGEAAPLCQLNLLDGGAGRELVAEAALGLSGYWSLEAGGPAMMMQQSGDLADRPDDATELARLLLASPSGPAPGLDELRPGQTVIGGSQPQPIFARLSLEDEAGFVICEATLG